MAAIRQKATTAICCENKGFPNEGKAASFLICWFLLVGGLSEAKVDGDSIDTVGVSIKGDAPVALTDNNFICATLDWWPPAKCDYGKCSWHHASLLNLNLTNPILENAVKAFSPLKIRLGGSLQDKVVYHVGKPSEPCLPFTKDQSSLFGFSGGCLPMWRWRELNQIFQKTGAEIAFGLNALYGRKRVNKSYTGPWNSSNARDFIQYTVDHGYQIQAWELGNELSGSGVGTSISAVQYAADIKELRKVVQEIYKDLPKPLVIAPDGFFDKKWLQDFLRRLDSGTVNAITHHIYNLGPGVAKDLVDKILDPSYLDKEAATFRALRDLMRDQAPGASAWVGEAGGAYNSGHHNVSDAFVNGFWYIDQLGMAASFGTKSYCRQSLIGGNYGLLDATTFRPNPDYYGALLWSRLMGERVLATKTTGFPYLRAYAHCTKNDSGVTLVLLNMSKKTQVNINVSIELSPTGDKPRGSIHCLLKQKITGAGKDTDIRKEFYLNAKDGDLHSHSVTLNGEALEVSASGEIPELLPKLVSNSLPITVAPLSIAFLTLPLQIPACWE